MDDVDKRALDGVGPGLPASLRVVVDEVPNTVLDVFPLPEGLLPTWFMGDGPEFDAPKLEEGDRLDEDFASFGLISSR
jgi:hypothetical protein